MPKPKEAPGEKEKKGKSGFVKTLTKIKNAVTPRDKKGKQTASVRSQSVSSRSDKSALSDRRVSQSPAPVAKPRRLSTSSAGSGRSPSVSEKSLDKKVAKQKKKTSESPSISSTLSPAPESKVEVDDETAHAEGGSVTPVVVVESEVEPAKLAGRDGQGVPSESPIVEETINEESVREPLSEAEIQGQNDEQLIEPSLQVTAEELIPPGSSRGLSPARSYGATEMEPPTTMSTRPQSSNSFNSGSLEESQPEQDVLLSNNASTSKEPVKTEADNEDQPPKDSPIKNDLEKQTEEETSSLTHIQDTACSDAVTSEVSKVELEEPAIAEVVDRSLPIDVEVTVAQTFSQSPFIHDTALEDISETKVFVDNLADPHSTALDTPVVTGALLDEEKTAASHQESLDTDGVSVDQDSLDLERAPSVDRASLDSYENNPSDRSSPDIEGEPSLDKTSTRMEGGDDDVVSVGGDIDSIDGASPLASDDGSLGRLSMEMGDASSDERSSLEMLDIPVVEPSGTKEERKQSIDALLKRTEGNTPDVAQDSIKVGDTPTHETPKTNKSAIAGLHARLPPETKAFLDQANPDTESIGSLSDAEDIPDDIAKMDDLDDFSEPQSLPAQDDKIDAESDGLTTPREEYPDFESLGSPSWSSQHAFPSDGEIDDLGSTPDPSYLSEGDDNAAVMELGVLTPPAEPPIPLAASPAHQAVAQPMPDLTKEAPAQDPVTSATKKSQLWDPLQKKRTPSQRLQVESPSTESPTLMEERKEPDVQVMEVEPVSMPRSPPLETSLFSTSDIVQEQPQNVSNQLPLTKKVQQWDPLMKQTRKLPSESSMQRPGVAVARMDQGKRPSLDLAKQSRMPIPRPRQEQKMVEYDLSKDKPTTSQHYSHDDPVEDDPPSQSSVDRHQRPSNDNPPNEEEKKPEERNPKRKKGNLIVSCALYVLGGIAVTVFFLRKRGG